MSDGFEPQDMPKEVPEQQQAEPTEATAATEEPGRPGDESTKLPSWLWWVLVAVAIVVIGAFLLLRSGPSVTTPQAVGLVQEAAEATITAAGLNVGKVSEVETLSAAPGIVVTQSPSPGSKVDENSNVDFAVAKLPIVTVPDITGRGMSEAQAELADQGLRPGDVGYAYSSQVGAGLIIAQDPEAGSREPVGSYVSVSVSLGTEKGQVPNVIGLPSEDAQDVLSEAGFEVKTVKAQSSSVPAGDVISQSPAAGTVTTAGSTVTITVSTGTAAKPEEPAPTLTTVPDVVGQRVLEAIRALRDAQLKFTIEFGPSEDNVLRVAEQGPAAGTQVERGSSITLTIGLPTFFFGDKPPVAAPLPAPMPEPTPESEPAPGPTPAPPGTGADQSPTAPSLEATP